MNLQTFYDHMKDALDFFGLRFADKSQVKVYIVGDVIVFTYDNKQISLRASE